MQQPYPHPYAVPPPRPRPKWQHPVLIIGLLFFLPPVGVLWVWLSRWPRRKKIIATVLSLLWFALMLTSDPPAEGKKTDAAPKRVTAVTKPSASPTRASSPSYSPSPEPSPSPSLSPSPTPKSTPTQTPKPKPLVRAVDRRWTSCAAAWKGGVPRDSGLTRDEHRGYRPALDADGDGHACGGDYPEEPEEEPTVSDDGGGSSGGSSGGGGAYYSSCAAARAAGAAPIHRGQPGYRAGLDRDGDGVACDR
ncbi:excalibur calcium-binding domain-containing protein [Streptomyces syringium]|uniref:excalibur calcium-binding domain-containing protein n=1 Tax=Streptomyces syringium TaxID=76729 RepID=UPI003D94E828